MAIKQVKQMCPKCKGSGINKDNVLTDDRGKVLLAPPYQKGEGDKPQFVNCKECDGEGLTLQPVPLTVLVDGEKLTLTPEEAQARYATV